MGRLATLRYSNVAILLHWAIAFLVLCMLALGKVMVSLETSDPLRFTFTQWHKTAGLLVLGLSIVRLIWRSTHNPPAIDYYAPAWQHRAASVTHILLYLLTLLIPVTGWIMVSASPLNLDTLFFGVVNVPHLPPFDSLPNRADIAEHFANYHEWASHVLILLLLMHAGAAIKHHLIEKDGVLLRMVPDTASRGFKRTLAGAGLICVAGAAALIAYAQFARPAPVLVAGSTDVSFIANVSQSETPGLFTDSSVDAALDLANPPNSRLDARVNTASVQSSNSQVQSQLPDTDWFDSENHPEATFRSTTIEAAADGGMQVTGTLNMKGTEQSVSFVLTIEQQDEAQIASGEFTIDRREFNIGMGSQNTDETVGFPVTIRFQFEIGAEPL